MRTDRDDLEMKLLRERRARAGIWVAALLAALAYCIAWTIEGNPLYAIPIGAGVCELLRRAVLTFRKRNREVVDFVSGRSGVLPLNPDAPIREYRKPRGVLKSATWYAIQGGIVLLVMWSGVSREDFRPGVALLTGIAVAMAFTALCGALGDFARSGLQRFRSASSRRAGLPTQRNRRTSLDGGS